MNKEDMEFIIVTSMIAFVVGFAIAAVTDDTPRPWQQHAEVHGAR